MKKLYTLALALTTVISAAAANIERSTSTVAAPTAETKTQRAPASRANYTIQGYEGDYIWNYYSLLQQTLGDRTDVASITVVDAETGEVNVDGIYQLGTGIKGKIKGILDVKAGTLTLANKQYLGLSKDGYQNYFYLKELDESGHEKTGVSAAESVTATVDGKMITFPEDCVFAIGDFNNEGLGWWRMTCKNVFELYVEIPADVLDLSEWTEVTTSGTMIDGWIMPALKNEQGQYLNPAENQLTVTVLRHKEYPNYYAVANPYMSASGFPLSDGEEGHIVFDISDPEYVLVLPQIFCGYCNGNDRMYCFNLEGWYAIEEIDKEKVKEYMQTLGINEWSTCTIEGNKVTINVPNCRFTYPNQLNNAGTWNGRVDAMKAVVSFVDTALAGLDNISVSDNTPAEYYNLQGIRVANPTDGIYIRRQGDRTEKVRF